MKQEQGFKIKLSGKQGRRAAALGLTLIMSAAVLSACTSASPEKQDKQVLRIGMMYGSPDNESWVRQQYTDTFEFTHPNTQLEIVYAINYSEMQGQQGAKAPDPYEKFKEMLTGKNPVDVVMIDYNQLSRMNQDGLLQQLDPLIAKDKLDISDYVPTVIDGIKAASENNNIYVLSPTFQSSALFYNKTIFQKAGVQPPTDKMTWQQVFDLARKVSSGQGADQVFGLALNRWSSDLYSNVTTYTAPLQLKIFDDKGDKMLVDSGSAWSNALKTMLSLSKDKVVPNQEDSQKIGEAFMKKYDKDNKLGYNPFQNDLFSTGNVAMTIADYGYISQMNNNKNFASQLKGFTPVDWDVATVPVFEEKPDIGGNSYLSQPMGINAKAQNPDGAWEFIKFLNSKEWAKLKSRSTYEIPSREEFIKPMDGMQYNIKAFYTLKPIPPASVNMDNLYREKPGISEVYSIGQELFQEAESGKKTPEEVMKEWAAKGNIALQKTSTDPQGATTDGGVSIESSTVITK